MTDVPAPTGRGSTLAPTPPPPDARPMRVLTASGSVYKLDPHTMTAFRLPTAAPSSAATASGWPCSAGRNRPSGRTWSCTRWCARTGMPTVRRTTPVVRSNYR